MFAYILFIQSRFFTTFNLYQPLKLTKLFSYNNEQSFFYRMHLSYLSKILEKG